MITPKTKRQAPARGTGKPVVRTAKPPRRLPAAATAAGPAGRASWGVLCYVAGDLGRESAPLRRDLREINLGVERSRLQVAWQFDEAGGARRQVRNSPLSDEKEILLGSVDSATYDTLLNFLRWALSVIDAERLVLVLRGDGVHELFQSDTDPNQARFTLCRDVSAGTELAGSELARAVASALGERGGRKIDLLILDTCFAQFLELAYQFDGNVDVLLASQTLISRQGFNYTKLLVLIAKTIADSKEPLDARQLGAQLVEPLFESTSSGDDTFALSALDLQRLEELARSFDALCMGTLQSLGEGVVWNARKLLRRYADRDDKWWYYDAGGFLYMFAAALDVAAEAAPEFWLIRLLTGGRAHDLTTTLLPAFMALGTAWTDPRLRRSWGTALAAARKGELMPERARALEDALQDVLLGRLRLQLSDRAKQAQLERLDPVFLARIQALREQVDPDERRDLNRRRAAAETARGLARLSRQAYGLLVGSSGAGAKNATDVALPGAGLVLACRSTDAENGWPRWTGVSLYRPADLNQLMRQAYAKFAIHGRIHWAAMLGAANLIEQHPRALWRLTSSLLSTGAAATRHEVLQRLTGPDSVLWGLRDQFQAMAPAGTLTLSLEQQRGIGSKNGAPLASHHEATTERYLLRLDSMNSGALVAEHVSRVHERVLERAMKELSKLPAQPRTRGAVRKLESIGALLAEDILQMVSVALTDERNRALQDGEGELHLQLQLPTALMQYPWELMRLNGEWLGELFPIGRQVFTRIGAARRVPERRQGSLRVLVIGDPHLDQAVRVRFPQLPAAQREARAVVKAFQQMKTEFGDLLQVDAHINTHLTGVDLRALLREGYDIVHFAGHGSYNGEDPLTSGWVLSDGMIWALELANTLGAISAPPWLIYGNACEAGQDGTPAAYQGNVFGLAGAFINNGVASYIAPLWEIEDELAYGIAVRFYEQVIRERRTVGDALRRAKQETRRRAFGEPPAGARPRQGDSDDEVVQGLGWASLVLYGDPTETVFQGLGGKQEEPAPQPTPKATAVAINGTVTISPQREAMPVVHLPDAQLVELVDTPRERKARRARSAPPTPEGEVLGELVLVQRGGLRHFAWRPDETSRGPATRGPPAPRALRGSPLPALFADPTFAAGAAERGLPRVLGSWLIHKLTGRNTSLALEYDRDQVRDEGLKRVDLDGRLRPLREPIPAPGAKDNAGLLVIVHGTFSGSDSPIKGLAKSFLPWAQQHYRAVLAFDHWTLSKDPKQNADMLAAQLTQFAPGWLEQRRLDLVTHSRGGLVARAFSELLPQSARSVRKLVFLATPNCGTDLANPDNWGAAADTLINLTGVPHGASLGRIAGLLARLSVQQAENAIPGLLAQNPGTAKVSGSILEQLQRTGANGVQHYVVSTEFGAKTLQLSPKVIADHVKKGTSNFLFQSPNDLVVNTQHVWCIDQVRGKVAVLPRELKPERVLLFGPAPLSFTPPPCVEHQVALGLHHNNLYYEPRVHERLIRWLGE